jgi:5-methylcytosine-specific restriction endonuclease McrA
MMFDFPIAQSPGLGISTNTSATTHLTERKPHIKKTIGNQLPRRKLLWLNADKKCHWCGRATLLCDNAAPDQATVDHVIPRGRGGPNAIENCVSACRQCNDDRNRRDMLSPGHKGPAPKASTTEDLIVALGEASRQRDAAVQQLNAQRAWKQRHLAELRMLLAQTGAASR